MAILRSQTTKGGHLVLDISIAPDELPEHLERAARDLNRERPLSGFRPGKAPYETVRRAIGDMALLERALRFAVPRAYVETVRTQHLATIGEPRIEVTQIVPGEPVFFTATVATMPEVVLGNYRNLREPAPKLTVNNEDVAEVLNELTTMRATERAVDRPATTNDRVVVDLTMSRDGVVLEGGQARDHKVDLTKPYVVPGFKEALIGLRPGEGKEFSLTFPTEHFDKNLAGKHVDYRVTMKQVFEVTPPQLDDAFAQSVGTFPTLEALREQLRSNLKEAKEQREAVRRERVIIEKLIAMSRFGEIPPLLIEAELQKILARVEGEVRQQGIEWSSYLDHLGKNVEELQRSWLPEAETRVKAALLIRAIAEAEHLGVNDQEISAERDLVLSHYQKPEDEDIREEIQSAEYDSHLRHLILTRKVMQFLSDSAALP